MSGSKLGNHLQTGLIEPKYVGAWVKVLHGILPESNPYPEARIIGRLVDVDAESNALIALGVVIEGETPHADLINTEVAHYLAKTSRRCGVPVIHEVVGTRNITQAVARCTSGETSRGWYAGCAAVEMATLYRAMEKTND